MYKRENAEQFIETIPEQLKDAVYRLLWKEYVLEDILSFCEKDRYEMDEETLAACENAAERYVEGDYDCNLSYWDNIENVIENEKIHIDR